MIISFLAAPIIHDLGDNGTLEENLDLDLNVCVYNKDYKLVDLVYYGHKYSKDNSIRILNKHQIEIDLNAITLDANYISFIVTSYIGKKFDKIPSFKFNLQETASAEWTIPNDENFINKSAILFFTLYKENDEWEANYDDFLIEDFDILRISKDLPMLVK
jgi:stress response protein SCP2